MNARDEAPCEVQRRQRVCASNSEPFGETDIRAAQNFVRRSLRHLPASGLFSHRIGAISRLPSIVST